MKINFVQTIIAIALSLLISYGLYSFHNSENKMLLSAGSFVFLAATLVMTIGNHDVINKKNNVAHYNSNTASLIFTLIIQSLIIYYLYMLSYFHSFYYIGG